MRKKLLIYHNAPIDTPFPNSPQWSAPEIYEDCFKRGDRSEEMQSSKFDIVRLISECGSTLYVSMALTAPPTNTNFQITLLLTQLQEALYED